MKTDFTALITKHQEALAQAASARTKQWWESYLKGVIPFRGVGIPQNRELLAHWRTANQIDTWPVEQQFELALAFFEQPFAEDKLAGILYIQNYLYDKLPWDAQLEKYDTVYQRKLIFDWNICDWFCVRVLGALIKKHGIECARAIAGWRDAGYVWQARSSLVPFVNLAAERDFRPFIEAASIALIKREERFAKTAVGWILREIFKHDAPFVFSFIDTHLASFSKESLTNALKYCDPDTRKTYQQALRAQRAASSASAGSSL